MEIVARNINIDIVDLVPIIRIRSSNIRPKIIWILLFFLSKKEIIHLCLSFLLSSIDKLEKKFRKIPSIRLDLFFFITVIWITTCVIVIDVVKEIMSSTLDKKITERKKNHDSFTSTFTQIDNKDLIL